MDTALLVIDMQNDYLCPARKPRFAYDTDALVGAVNGIIHTYSESGCPVAYVRHIIHDFPTNRLLFGYSIAGTEGAALYEGLDIVSEICFDKYFGDALTNRALRDWLRQNGVRRIHLCGLDECGCVTATALGAVRRGYEAAILRAGTATVFSGDKVERTHRKLKATGVGFI